MAKYNTYENFALYIHRIYQKGEIKINEIVNVENGNILSYYLNGLSANEYFNLRNFQNKGTICYTSFNDCVNGLNEEISADPVDNAVCDFLPCATINYGVCTIASGSGYIQGSSNYIGDSNCSSIYNGDGVNIKDLNNAK
ncbi:hypothetical protein [Salegentibacter maritimus]|uniref:Uncharacterized protein n=1 Tax=Salegentibacter maritimus TaxID=2794347 RepID=A0ABS0TN52_9FLAO|nr:hypothetical protein [Salegentibacter maritimus]MBI6121464.1 hypothetical protein [Salegentibacter maritimus]